MYWHSYDIFITCRKRKAQSSIKDTSHPAHTLFSLQPSGKRYQGIKSRTTRFRDSSFPQVVRIMNRTPTHINMHTHPDTKAVPIMWMALLLLCFFLRYHLVILSIVFFISFPRLRVPQCNYFLYLLSQGILILASASGINKLNQKKKEETEI